MSPATRSTSGTLIIVQIALATVGLLVLALMPPSNGPMALVALDGRSADRLVAPAIADDAQVLGRGPLKNVLIVRGDRADVVADMLTRGVIVITAPRGWCGAEDTAA